MPCGLVRALAPDDQGPFGLGPKLMLAAVMVKVVEKS
jgi:hypothetical protein